MRLQKTLLRGVLGPSDLGRWSKASSLLPVWDSRTIQMAALIPAGSRILDVGAGAMVLKDHLPERCLYTPADLVARSAETVVLDLNGPELPRLPATDVVFLSGVLEYVVDLDRLLKHLYESTTFIVASYASSRGDRMGKLHRRSRGWVNDYSQDTLLSLFLHHGFHCEHVGAWYDQGLFRFRKMQIQPAFVRD
jgi:hypothetical protein